MLAAPGRIVSSWPLHDRWAMLPSPGQLNRVHCGFGYENRVYLFCASVVCVIKLLPRQGIDRKIQIGIPGCDVTLLQDYPCIKGVLSECTARKYDDGMQELMLKGGD